MIQLGDSYRLAGQRLAERFGISVFIIAIARVNSVVFSVAAGVDAGFMNAVRFGVFIGVVIGIAVITVHLQPAFMKNFTR